MGKNKRNGRFRVKRLLYCELADYYSLHRDTVKKALDSIDLYTVAGVIEAVRLLDGKRKLRLLGYNVK